jgi:hypothetical protein
VFLQFSRVLPTLLLQLRLRHPELGLALGQLLFDLGADFAVLLPRGKKLVHLRARVEQFRAQFGQLALQTLQLGLLHVQLALTLRQFAGCFLVLLHQFDIGFHGTLMLLLQLLVLGAQQAVAGRRVLHISLSSRRGRALRTQIRAQ